jgi:hypothetical protein
LTKKRSRYRPKPVRLDVMAFVRAGMRQLAEMGGELATLKIKNHDALTSLVQGRASRHDMEILICTCNMTAALAVQGYGKEWTEEIVAGEAAVLAIATRPRWLCRGEELNAVREMFDVHDAQLEVVTVREIETAMDYIDEVKRNKLAKRIAA